MADVYLSHSPGDAATASRIRSDLERKGISCDTSSTDTAAGSLSLDDIPQDIRQAPFFVILVSRHALSSPIVKTELYWATEANRRIIPIHLDRTPLNDTFHFYLGTKQWITAKRRLSAASRELCDMIYAELHPIAHPPENDTTDKAADLHKNDKALAIRVVLCVLICLVYMAADAVLFTHLRKNDLGLYWDIDSAVSLVMIVILFIIMAPLFGGYKTFLRTILEKLRDVFRGK